MLNLLDKKQDNNSGKGVPVLSRIPVLKWFFSSRTKIKRKFLMGANKWQD